MAMIFVHPGKSISANPDEAFAMPCGDWLPKAAVAPSSFSPFNYGRMTKSTFNGTLDKER